MHVSAMGQQLGTDRGISQLLDLGLGNMSVPWARS